MPVGFIRRLARQSYRTTFVLHVNTFPTLQDNWTTQQTTTYDANNPAAGPGVWGGTLTDLDREFTATGSGYTVDGALLTFVQKPEGNSLGQSGSLGGLIAKVQPTYPDGSTAAFEVWSLKGTTWTKRRRIPLATVCRSGETVVIDATGPVLADTDVDAYWVTLAPDIGSETLTWLALHVYGICLNDPVTPACPPGTPPEDCEGPECGVDRDSWLCLPPPEEPTPAPNPNPFVLPGIPVKIPNPTTYVFANHHYFHDCPRPTQIVMLFGEIPDGGSVTVTVANTNGVVFAEGVQQTIVAPGTMTWTVTSGFHAQNAPATSALPPAQEAASTDFLFTRKLDGSAFAVAGNLLDILEFWWTYNIGFQEVC